MATNDNFVQLQGPFSAKEDLIKWITNNYNSDFKYIKKIGIQAPSTHHCVINGYQFEIGKTNILELNDVKITALYFSQEELPSTLVDCILY